MKWGYGLVFFLLMACGSAHHLQDSGAPTEITGIWRRQCFSLSRGGYGKDSLDLGNTVFDSDQDAYSDSGCTKHVASYHFAGKYALGTGTIDLDLQFLEVTLDQQSDVDTYNTYAICGASNWAVGVKKECPNSKKTLYQIYATQNK